MKYDVDFAHVRAHADMAAVLAHYGITLKGTGAQKEGLCPFHDDTKPSLKVNITKNLFNCFVCGNGGNVIDFVLAVDDDITSPRQAALQVAKLSRIEATGRGSRPAVRTEPPAEEIKVTPPVSVSAKTLAEDEEAQEEIDGVLHNRPLTFQLKLDVEAAKPWLHSRGFTDETIAKFGLGMATRGTMKGRICIPIHNAAGELVAYCGRYPSDDVPDGEPKYKFPAGFRKELELYNLHRVPRGVTGLLMVESPLSVFRASQIDAGCPIVATMGTTISPEQVVALVNRRKLEMASGVKIIVMFDGDEAGRTGAKKVVGELAAAGAMVGIMALPDGQKPHHHTGEQEEVFALMTKVVAKLQENPRGNVH